MLFTRVPFPYSSFSKLPALRTKSFCSGLTVCILLLFKEIEMDRLPFRADEIIVRYSGLAGAGEGGVRGREGKGREGKGRKGKER